MTGTRDSAVRDLPRPAPRTRAVRAWWRRFVHDVLARPLRIGVLGLLALSVTTVAVGAQGWWIVLGVVLFLAAASGLVALWLEEP